MVNRISPTSVAWTYWLALSTCCLSLSGCGSASRDTQGAGADPDTIGPPDESVVEAAMPITTVDDMLPDLIDGTAGSLTFKAGSAASQIEPGALIVGATSGAAFVRRVVDVAVTDSKEITLVTEDVPLDEAFSLVDVEVPGTFLSFTPADGVTVVEQSQSSRTIAGVDGQAAREMPVLDLDLTYKTNDNNAEASVGIKLKSSAILELKAGMWTGLQKIKVSMPSDYEIELGLAYKAAEAKYELFENEITLGRAKVLFWIGPVPVYNEFLLVGEISANFSGALTVSTKGSSEIGGQWTREAGWSEILTHQAADQQGKAKGQASAQLMVTAKWYLYGAVGPALGLGPYIQATLDALQPCDVEIAGGMKIEAALQFGAKVLNEDLRDEKAFTFERKFESKFGTFKLCETGPNAPTNLLAGANEGKPPVGLAWTDNSEDESNFLVERKTENDWYPMVLLPADTTTYADKSPRDGKENSYRVSAVWPSGEQSQPSNTGSVSIEKQKLPNAPTDLGAVVVNTGTVVLTWTDQSEDESKFIIERATDGGGFDPLGAVDTNVESYADISVEADRSYLYQVAAANLAGASAWSNPAPADLGLIDVPGGKPAAPSHLTATLSGTTVTLTWRDHSSKEDSFVVERNVDGGGFAAVGSAEANANSTADTVPDASKIYSYRIFAVNDEGASDYSNVARTDEAAGKSPNDEICETLGLCCANDNVCDSAAFDCPEEDADCALCGVHDGRCPEMCIDGDPDCPSRELICGVMETCCAGDNRCDTQCPLSDPDPDCTNAVLCQQTGFCCSSDGQCHEFCNEPDTDCDPSTGSQGGGPTGTCSSVSYFASIGATTGPVETPIRVVATGVDERLCATYTSFDCSAVGLSERTRPIEVCDTETVQVFDDNGNNVGSFTIPFSLIDGRGADLPWVLIVYTPGVQPALSVTILFSETGDTVDLTIGDGGGTACSPGDCPTPTGGCCVDRVCTEESEDDCTATSGTYAGDDVACADMVCTPPEDYVVWYTGNVCCWGAPLVYISTRSSFEAGAPKSSYPGGGIDSSIPVTKVELQGGFATSQEAQAWLCPQVVSRFNHYWCGSGYVQMNGANWQIGACDTSNLPFIGDAPDVDMCQ